MEGYKYHEFMPKHLPRLSPEAGFCASVTIFLASLSYILLRSCQPKHKLQEPIAIPQSVPYIAHILGIIKHGLGYYKFIQ